MSTQALVKVDGQRLQKLRSRRPWLVGDLAEESGVHRNTISQLENDRGGAYPETIRKLAKASRCRPYRTPPGVAMPDTNGHGPKRIILRTRVSTDEQARSGYSLAQQIEADLYRATPGA